MITSMDGVVGVSLVLTTKKKPELYLGAVSFLDYSSYKEKDSGYLTSPAIYFYVEHGNSPEFVITNETISHFKKTFARTIVAAEQCNYECEEQVFLRFLEDHLYEKVSVRTSKG